MPGGICLSTVCDRRHLGVGGADVHTWLEEDLDDAHAGQRLRFDMFDVVEDGAQGAFVGVDHPTGHGVRREAVVLPDHGDHGDADIGKYVGGRSQCGLYQPEHA